MEKQSLKQIEDFILAAGSDDLETFGGTFQGGVHCQQVPDEIAPCIFEILNYGDGVCSYLEIGVAAGGTTYLFNHFFAPERIVLIDDNKHHKAALRKDVLAGVETHEIIGRSDDEASIAAARSLSPYDMVFIDGDHLYAGVKLDTLLYVPMMRAGGWLALHDSALPEWGVARVVRELRADQNMRFIGEYKSKTHGRPLGVALFRRAA